MFPNITFGHHDYVFGYAHSFKTQIRFLRRAPSMRAVGHNNQQIQIAIRPHPATGCRSKQNNSEWFNRMNDAIHVK